MKIQTPPPTPPLEGRGAAAALSDTWDSAGTQVEGRGTSAAWDSVGTPLPCRGGAGVGSVSLLPGFRGQYPSPWV